MKTLKITLLLVAVVCLTVSFTSTKTSTKDDVTTMQKDTSSYDKLVVNQKKKKAIQQG